MGLYFTATQREEKRRQELHSGCPGQLNLARSVDSLPWAQRPQGHLERLTFVSSGALEVVQDFSEALGGFGGFGRLWGRLGTPGDVWGRLGTFGNAWGRLGTFEDAWGRLGTLGDAWEPVLAQTGFYPRLQIVKGKPGNQDWFPVPCLLICKRQTRKPGLVTGPLPSNL
mgnify:CR=1 FL=1